MAPSTTRDWAGMGGQNYTVLNITEHWGIDICSLVGLSYN